MNLVASAILRGMVGASSSADLAGVPGNKRAKARGDASEAEPAPESAGDSLKAALAGGEDARAALKGVQGEADLKEKSQGQENQGWSLFRPRQNGADAVRISDTGRNAPSAAGAQFTAQCETKSASTGKKLSIKI